MKRRSKSTVAAVLLALLVAGAGYIAGRVQEREELMPMLAGMMRIVLTQSCTIEPGPAVAQPDIEAH